MSYKRIAFGERVVLILSFVLLLVNAGAAFADVKLPAVISDNMVLQRGMKVPIWGWSEPGEKIFISVTWQSMGYGARAGNDGKWMVKLFHSTAGGPFEITIVGKNTIKIENVVVGEVWVCSGQSNMQWPVTRSANAEQAIAAADHKFVWADAKIDGDTVVVSSDKVSEPRPSEGLGEPVAARYGWANNPVCNLYNKEGLPASPFRTDDRPGITVGKK